MISAGARFRLLISEYERFEVDAKTLARVRPGDADPGRRLAFAEAHELTPPSGALPLTG
jgi:hypothetical protein